MSTKQHIFRVRRNYNQWVANETLEDYALRFTAKKVRRWSLSWVAATALGAISFLALEAIGGALTLQYGFYNTLYAALSVGLIIFLTAIPISYYAAKYGVDSDLLTRGAGFGYLGSTITSLIYASFTFIFFAIEAAIMAMALEILFSIPLALGYILSALAIIPLVTHGISLISRFQIWTQPLWIFLQLAPFVFILWKDIESVENWTQFSGYAQSSHEFNIVFFGAACAVIFALIAQIGEQVDFLRFLPEPNRQSKRAWWGAVLMGGPGWIIIGIIKIMAGSFLAVLALQHGVAPSSASDPTHMYRVAFGYITHSPEINLAAAGIFVILCQVKINVTNAYAGSIAWSNFFSRLTHSHPGRVVWLVFNVCIALLVMQLGVYKALEETLGHYALIAIAWAGALVADLVINKPLGLSPKHIEFKRAHLYDINPVGVGAMLIASIIGAICFSGVLGGVAQALAHFITLGVALLTAPLIAWKTQGRYYLARPTHLIATDQPDSICCICENKLDIEDLAFCPAYKGVICSLCCSLDARCGDSCKENARYTEQIRGFFLAVVPAKWIPRLGGRIGHFLSLMLLINSVTGFLLLLTLSQAQTPDAETHSLLGAVLLQVFFILLIITGVISWLFVLAHESRHVAQEESNRQTQLLLEEIEAHEKTDLALQKAKELAEAANLAKSKYLTGISHELRSPLNAVMGYAQLLHQDPKIPAERREALLVIRRSSEYLADLIEGLLDISKIEAGKLDLQSNIVRIDLLLDQIVHMFRLQAQEKGLGFSFHCPYALPHYVKTDEKRLRQILINLLSNAIKYTDKGQVSLTVRYRNEVAEFKIEDTGEGIATQDIERIFMPFERIRSAHSNATGTGLGLTITKLLCEILGGDINVQSQLGCGSVFKVSLLLSSIRQVVDQPSAQFDKPVRGYTGNCKHLLVIDDETSHRQLMRSILEPIGFKISELSNPLLALDYLKSNTVDLIFLDLSMPYMNGWELLQTLRDANVRVPIIIISANAMTNDPCPSDGSMNMLHDAFIKKPIQLHELIEKIGQLINIQWLYDTHDYPLPKQTIDCTLPLSSLAQQDEILRLASIGHRKGLLKLLYELKQSDTENGTFYKTLIGHAENFQFEQVKTYVQEWVDEIP
ncbi:hybrid sensor histidine kinase/response regulator [Nitrincola alkalisediminis]|uniref:hybrid sensor histidine kinase/response regulator n=1 Tax=Nitrincola alkalisediminis TaxID=1366656 RepID=UPI00187630FC|nr:ATP-binding protein [Nitrincola alkalisediminis]